VAVANAASTVACSEVRVAASVGSTLASSAANKASVSEDRVFSALSTTDV